MNLLKLELLLFWEFGKLYEKYGLSFKLVQQNIKTHRYFNLICNNTNEIVMKNITKKMLLGILQDNTLGLYSRRYDELIQKINRISITAKTQKLKIQI